MTPEKVLTALYNTNNNNEEEPAASSKEKAVYG
jgi:hypothetical protein